MPVVPFSQEPNELPPDLKPDPVHLAMARAMMADKLLSNQESTEKKPKR